MKNAINNQFKMNPGSKEVDTEGTFKNDPAVMNMGTPTNYGTPMTKTDPDKKKTSNGPQNESRKEKGERVYREAMQKIKKQKNAPKPKSSFISMGLGTGRSSGKNILGK